MSYYIGIDLGGTNVAAGMVQEDGKLLGKASVPCPRGGEAVADAIAQAARLAAEAAGVSMEGAKGVGLASSGSIDPERGEATPSTWVWTMCPWAEWFRSGLGDCRPFWKMTPMPLPWVSLLPGRAGGRTPWWP